MTFRFASITTAENHILGVPYIVISITTPGERQAKFVPDPNRKDILRLVFHDVDKAPPDIQWGDGKLKFDITLFSAAMAKAIVAFVKKYEDKVDVVLCHCEGGICRSPAVVAAFEKVYKGDDSWVFQGSNPNRLVYRKMLAALIPPTP